MFIKSFITINILIGYVLQETYLKWYTIVSSNCTFYMVLDGEIWINISQRECLCATCSPVLGKKFGT